MSTPLLEPGVTRAGEGRAWNILGHTYWLKAWCPTSFAFETCDPPGSFIPAHVHHAEYEFIQLLQGRLDLQVGDTWYHAEPGDLMRLPRGVAHAYYNNTDEPARTLFWLCPAGQLKELFDAIDSMSDIPEVCRLAAAIGVDFMPLVGPPRWPGGRGGAPGSSSVPARDG